MKKDDGDGREYVDFDSDGDQVRASVPSITPKSKGVQCLGKWDKADTGGDPYARQRQQYAKNPPQTESDDNSLYGF